MSALDQMASGKTGASGNGLINALIKLVLFGGGVVFSAYMAKKIQAELMSPPPTEQQKRAKQLLEEKALQTGREAPSDLTNHELQILTDVVFPNQIQNTFDDIGGLENIKEQIWERVIVPLQHPEILSATIKKNGQEFKSSNQLLRTSRGVLLYGPPGCGKTLIAKAIAKTTNATFINVRASTLQNKWFGESQKMVRALFSVAEKFAPSIIFIDELDLLARRGGSDSHEAHSSLLSELLTLWDGLNTSNESRILVLAATNKPNDIDKAVLRRLPLSFAIDLPDEMERLKILQVFLRHINLEESVDFSLLAKQTKGYSGSDIEELCRTAAMQPIKEHLRNKRKAIEFLQKQEQHVAASSIEEPVPEVRAVSKADFDEALKIVKPYSQRKIVSM